MFSTIFEFPTGIWHFVTLIFYPFFGSSLAKCCRCCFPFMHYTIRNLEVGWLPSIYLIFYDNWIGLHGRFLLFFCFIMTVSHRTLFCILWYLPIPIPFMVNPALFWNVSDFLYLIEVTFWTSFHFSFQLRIFVIYFIARSIIANEFMTFYATDWLSLRYLNPFLAALHYEYLCYAFKLILIELNFEFVCNRQRSFLIASHLWSSNSPRPPFSLFFFFTNIYRIYEFLSSLI